MKETWLKDANENKCSVEYFGSQEAAQKALDSLKDCQDCTNCSRCYGCSGCYDCSRCYGCSGCYDCSGCSRCYDCSRCSDCSGCYDCSRCSDCSGCYDCSGCSDCSRCYDCSGCSGCYDKKGEEDDFKPPIVPIIPDIHKVVYAAASRPEALAMESVHTCENTHCRGGWIITLAGEAGRKLEQFYGWNLAAMKIYDASAPGFKINPCRFFDNNQDALEDMKRLAEQ